MSRYLRTEIPETGLLVHLAQLQLRKLFSGRSNRNEIRLNFLTSGRIKTSSETIEYDLLDLLLVVGCQNFPNGPQADGSDNIQIAILDFLCFPRLFVNRVPSLNVSILGNY